MILLDADKTILKVRATETITSGSVKVYPVRFKFSSDWDGFVKTAVFRTAVISKSVVLDETNECTIPWEVLVRPNDIWDRQKLRLEVGVHGTKGETTVLPTVWADLGIIREGTEPGESTQEPTPSVYQQLMAQLAEGRDAAIEAAGQAKGYTAQAIQEIQAEGTTQVERVIADGAVQTAAAKAEADRAEIARDEAEKLAYLTDKRDNTNYVMKWSINEDGYPTLTLT